MGIQGLLGALKPITTPVHVRELQGLRVGVDAYVWLHRGVFGCAAELCQGKDTKRYLHACFQRLNLLLSNGIGHVCIVFDGGPLPAKRGTEDERRARREENRRKALQLVAEGRAVDAFPYFTKAVDVTPAMAKEWMNTIQASGLQNVTCVVAPYEADAQLAYLCRTGQLDAVFTEDSDLLATGCPRVLFKLEEATGMAQQIVHADIFKAPIPGLGDLRTWDGEAFLVMCILSGCDYLSSVAGLGLRSAYRLVHRHKTATKAIRAMRFDAKHKVPADYEARFLEALKTFRHQRVFDPVARVLTHVHPLPLDNANVPTHPTAPAAAAAVSAFDYYLGPWMEDALAADIADGMVDPITLAPFPSSLFVAPFAATCAASAVNAASATAASASASQPKISAFLTAARHRQQEGKDRDGEATDSVGTTAVSIFSTAVKKNAVYRPRLRKSSGPVPLRQNNRLTSYLNNNATATEAVAAAMKSSGSCGSFRALPAIFRKRKNVSTNSGGSSSSSSGAEGSDAVSLMPLPPASHEDAPDEAPGGGGEGRATSATGVMSRLPRLSSWFGGKGEKKAHTKEDYGSSVGLGGLPSFLSPSSLSSSSSSVAPPPSSLSSSSSPSSSSLASWKRQRTLGGRPSAFALRRFAFGGGGATSAAEEEEMEVGEGLGSRRPTRGLSDSKEGAEEGYGSDSLQPPTPGTPYGGAAAAAAGGAAVAAVRPLSQIDLDEAGDDDGERGVAVVGNAASAAAAAATSTITTTMQGSEHISSTTLISFEPFLYQNGDNDASDSLDLKRGVGKSVTTATASTKAVNAPASTAAAAAAATFSQATPNSRRRGPQDHQKQSSVATAAGRRGRVGEGGQVNEGEGDMSLSLNAFKFDGDELFFPL